MDQFLQTAGQLGPYALFSILVIYMVFQVVKLILTMKEKKAAAETPVACDDLAVKVGEIHAVVMRQDGDGVKLTRTLEGAIVRLTDLLELQMKVLQKMTDDIGEVRRDIVKIQH